MAVSYRYLIALFLIASSLQICFALPKFKDSIGLTKDVGDSSSSEEDSKDDTGLDTKTFNGHQYYFHFADERNYFPAYLFCRQHNMELASIQSKEESDWITGVIKDNVPDASKSSIYWISGTDKHQEGLWLWIGTGQPFTFTNWAKGEPSNTNDIENCLQIRKDLDYKWNDSWCDNLAGYFICETEEKIK